MVTGKSGELRKKFASTTSFVPAELVPSTAPRDDVRFVRITTTVHVKLSLDCLHSIGFLRRFTERMAPAISELFEHGDRVVFLGQEYYGALAVVEAVQVARIKLTTVFLFIGIFIISSKDTSNSTLRLKVVTETPTNASKFVNQGYTIRDVTIIISRLGRWMACIAALSRVRFLLSFLSITLPEFFWQKYFPSSKVATMVGMPPLVLSRSVQ